MRNYIVAATIWLILLDALAACPTSHFEPTIEFGSYFPGYDSVLARQISASPDAELALVYVEFGTREPGFGASYLITLVRDGLNGGGTLYLNRLKDGKPVSRQLRINANEVRDLIQKLIPILQNTHYSPSGCPVHFLDGFLVQMAVEEPGRGLIGGQVFNPMADWESGKAVAIGRMLKARILSEDGK